jgi:hypothetical protein
VGKFLSEIKSQRAGQSNRIDQIVADLDEQDDIHMGLRN